MHNCIYPAWGDVPSMSDTPQDRICTLCGTQFAPRVGIPWSGYGLCFMGLVATLLVEAAARPGPLLTMGLCCSWAIGCWWIHRRIAVSRERACPACGSSESVPLQSPVGIALHQRSTSSISRHGGRHYAPGRVQLGAPRKRSAW